MNVPEVVGASMKTKVVTMRLAVRMAPIRNGLSAARARFPDDRRLARQLADVRTGHERSSRAGDDRATDVFADADLVDGIAQFAERRVVERVELVGSVDRERRDPVGDLEGEKLIGHAGEDGSN